MIINDERPGTCREIVWTIYDFPTLVVHPRYRIGTRRKSDVLRTTIGYELVQGP